MIFLVVLEAAAATYWSIRRWPRLGPHGIAQAGLVLLAAFLAFRLMPDGAGVVTRLAGAPVALTFVVLPSFTWLFWSGACFARALTGTASAAGAR